MESPTKEMTIQCELLTIPSSSTPVCGTVKNLGGCSEDDKRDRDYIPSINMSFDKKEDDFDEFENDQLKYSIFSKLVLIIELLSFLFLPARFYFILNFY